MKTNKVGNPLVANRCVFSCFETISMKVYVSNSLDNVPNENLNWGQTDLLTNCLNYSSGDSSLKKETDGETSEPIHFIYSLH